MMQYLTYLLLFVTILHARQTTAQDIEWTEVEGLGFTRYHHPFVETTENGKKYLYHLESETKADQLEDHAADLMTVIKDGRYGVFRTDGRLILPFEYDEIDLQTDYQGQWYDGIPYNHKYIIIKKDGQYGYADDRGNILASPQYQKIKVISHALVTMQADHLWGWMDGPTGKVLQTCIYDDVRKIYFSDNYVQVEQQNLSGLAKSDGQVIIPISYEDLYISSTADNTYIKALKAKSTTLYDSLGQVKVSPSLDDIRAIGNSKLLQYRQGDRYGLLDPSSGKIITEAKYNNIRTGLRGRYIVEQNKQYGIVDDNGKEIIPVGYTAIEFVDATNSRKEGTLFGPKAPPRNPPTEEQLLRQRRDSVINTLPYYIRVHKDNTSGIYDWEGKQIIPTGTYTEIQPHYHKDVFYKVYNAQRLFGILNALGKEILPPNHYPYSSYNYSKDAIKSNLDLAYRYIPFQQSQDQYAYPAPIGLFDLETASIIISPSPQSIDWLDKDHLVVLKRDGSKPTAQLYTQDGELIYHLGEDISQVETLGEERLLIGKGSQYYMVDFKGNTLYSNPKWTIRGYFTPSVFPKLNDLPSGNFYAGLKKVYAGESNLFVNRQGQEVRFSAYDYVDAFYGGTALVANIEYGEDEDGYSFTKYRYGLIDPTGEELHPLEWDRVSTYAKDTDYLLVYQDEKQGIARRDGTYTLPIIYDHIASIPSNNPYIQIKLNGKFGMTTLDGDIVIETRYDQLYRATSGDEGTWPLLVQDGEWYYFVNKDGTPYPIRSKQRTY